MVGIIKNGKTGDLRFPGSVTGFWGSRSDTERQIGNSHCTTPQGEDIPGKGSRAIGNKPVWPFCSDGKV